MPTEFFQVVGVIAPSGSLCWCRLTYPGSGATAVEFALAEQTNSANDGLSIFNGGITAAIDDSFAGQLILNVRQVSALNAAAYNVATITRATGTYDRVFFGTAPKCSNRMQQATELLMRDFKQGAGIQISYSRGPVTIASIIATKGRADYMVDSGEVMIAKETPAWFIEACDLKVSGTQWLPQSGDRITDPQGQIFEVSAPKGFNVYESLGPDGTTFKVHTVGPR